MRREQGPTPSQLDGTTHVSFVTVTTLFKRNLIKQPGMHTLQTRQDVTDPVLIKLQCSADPSERRSLVTAYMSLTLGQE
jgi:hypothetical protein